MECPSQEEQGLNGPELGGAAPLTGSEGKRRHRRGPGGSWGWRHSGWAVTRGMLVSAGGRRPPTPLPDLAEAAV